MMSKPIVSFLAMLTLAGVAVVRSAHAEDLEFRAVIHAASVQTQDIGDVEGHVVGIVRFSGIASFQDGSTALASFVAQNDYVKGSGTNSAYSNLTFDDGSVLWYKANGTAAADGSRTILKGTITVIGGKGRFAGAKGEGGYTGARVGTLATGADLFLDQMITVKK